MKVIHRLSIARLGAAIGATIGLGLFGNALADTHSDANAAHARGDYSKELSLLRPEADSGEAWAQNNLGNLYLFGNGVPIDDDQAYAWFSKAADQGDAGGEVNLGQMYEQGLGVPPNPPQAASLYLKAAEQDYHGGWALLKRLCDKQSSIPECAQIPAGTQSAPQWDLHGKSQILLQLAMSLLTAGVAIYFFVVRMLANRRNRGATLATGASSFGSLERGSTTSSNIAIKPAITIIALLYWISSTAAIAFSTVHSGADWGIRTSGVCLMGFGLIFTFAPHALYSNIVIKDRISPLLVCSAVCLIFVLRPDIVLLLARRHH